MPYCILRSPNKSCSGHCHFEAMGTASVRAAIRERLLYSASFIEVNDGQGSLPPTSSAAFWQEALLRQGTRFRAITSVSEGSSLCPPRRTVSGKGWSLRLRL